MYTNILLACKLMFEKTSPKNHISAFFIAKILSNKDLQLVLDSICTFQYFNIINKQELNIAFSVKYL